MQSYEYAGASVGRVGDFNGDGFDDFVISDFDVDGPDAAYLIFGAASGLPLIELANLTGSQGFAIGPIDVALRANQIAAGAGDINGDGLADLIVGSPNEQAAYVLFGTGAPFGPVFFPTDLNGSNGFAITGGPVSFGSGVGAAGDFNGDGIDDLFVTADYANLGAAGQGAELTVIFGQTGDFGSSLNVADLSYGQGLHIQGIANADQSGFAARATDVRSAGDVNGDGYDDLIIGARHASNQGGNSGEAYVVFGGGFGTSADFLGSDGSQNFVGTGADEILIGGRGDDFLDGGPGDDVIIGAEGNDTIIYDPATDTRRVDGGTGDDTLRISAAGVMLSLTDLNLSEHYQLFRNFEVLDLGTGNGNTLNLDLADLRGMTDIRNTLRIDGDASNTVNVAGQWILSGNPNLGGNPYLEYRSGNATLQVQEGLDLNISLAGVNVPAFVQNANNGTRIPGEADGDLQGQAVGGGGDFNGDGLADIVLAAPGTQNNPNSFGTFYTAFSPAANYPSPFDLATLNGSTGFASTVTGPPSDLLYSDLSLGGDINGDGLADLVIGAGQFDGNNGAVFVVFGAAAASDPLALDGDLDGNNGFAFHGESTTRTGFAVDMSGDINNDGFEDLIIGAIDADGAGGSRANSGQAYVILGHGSPFSGAIGPMDIGSTVAGFVIDGVAANDRFGQEVAILGDINGDGFDDMAVASRSRSTVAVLYGAPTGSLPVGTLDLAALSPSQGFTITGINATGLGRDVTGIGDFNGDGIDDFAISDNGGSGSDPAGYILFGRSGGFGGNIDLNSFGSTDGIRLIGVSPDEYAGESVAAAGDFNGDGFDDVLFGSPGGVEGSNPEGDRTYLLFGGNGATDVDVSTPDGARYLTLLGALPSGYNHDMFGYSISAAGDVNGDGFHDLLIGAPYANTENGESGEAYILFGANPSQQSAFADNVYIGDDMNNVFLGTAVIDNAIGGRGDDTLDGRANTDILIGGLGNDILITDGVDFRLDGGGGFDTVQLESGASGVNLDLAATGRITGVEQIDITGSGDNQLTLNLDDVLDISDSTNDLLIVGNTGDAVADGNGALWTANGTQDVNGTLFSIFELEAARLIVHPDLDTSGLTT